MRLTTKNLTQTSINMIKVNYKVTKEHLQLTSINYSQSPINDENISTIISVMISVWQYLSLDFSRALLMAATILAARNAINLRTKQWKLWVHPKACID